MVIKRRDKLVGILIFVCAVATVGFLWNTSKQKEEMESEVLSSQGNNDLNIIQDEATVAGANSGTDGKVHQTEKFSDKYFFEKGIAMADQTTPQKEKIYGAILPHHLIPSFIIADIFQRIADQGTKTIILLAPNHHNIGFEPVLTSFLPWQTSYGNIQVDHQKTKKILSKKYVGIDDDILDNEHAVGGLAPFIAYYNSDIKIIPLILKQDLTIGELDNLQQSLAQLMDKNTVVVSSVDFSHYLSSQQAEKNDQKTLQAMQDNNYGSILAMNSDYLDSPEAIVALLKIMKTKKTDKLKVLYNTNSGRLTNNPFTQTTSYFGIIFTK